MKENLFNDLENICPTARDIRREDPSLRGSTGHLTKILVKLMRKSGVSYPDGLNAENVFTSGRTEL